MQPMLTAAWMMVMVVVSNALDLLPTAVVPTPQRTKAPAEVVVPEYAQTLYKATDYSVWCQSYLFVINFCAINGSKGNGLIAKSNLSHVVSTHVLVLNHTFM
ncbi:hypothetical protein E2C01_048208 [Portunus trituberculatus]|uniref:Secreted protein n=1 Tax=Portunus trituberculatus TaxID=210409 RepID=A0A5B7GAX6_PORTR|nr:hypothetical protein [Portunus trituberculatus]